MKLRVCRLHRNVSTAIVGTTRIEREAFEIGRASDYDLTFTRKTGWTGADGSYSISLGDGRTLWLFSDTLMGEVDEHGRRWLDQRIPINKVGHRFIRNSAALQEGHDPHSVRFITGKNGEVPASIFRPATGEGWFWVNGAINTGIGCVTVLLNQFIPGNPGDPGECCFGKQVALWAVDVQVSRDELQVGNYRRILVVDPADEDGQETVWGAGILVEAPWIYVYGCRFPGQGRPQDRRLIVARVPGGQLGNGEAWQFLCGDSFVRGSHRATALPVPVSNEISVHKLRDGHYMLVHADGFWPISVCFAASPAGPWSVPQTLWIPDESTFSVFSYNPKAHPELSDERGLLISYNVNSYDEYESLADADVYRPRFIRAPWELIEQQLNNAEFPVSPLPGLSSAA